jgi:hypothetical protein
VSQKSGYPLVYLSRFYGTYSLTISTGFYLQRHGVVDDHGLAEVSWRQLGIGQLGVEVHAEAGVVVDLLVAEKDELASLGALDVLLQDVVDDGIDVLVTVHDQHRKAVLDAHLELLEEVRVVEGDHFEVVFLFLLLDPDQVLLLRVNAVGEATGLDC